MERGPEHDVYGILTRALAAAAWQTSDPEVFLAEAGPAFVCLIARTVGQLGTAPARTDLQEAIVQAFPTALERSLRAP